MKKVTMIIEVDLGLVQDDFNVTQFGCESCLNITQLTNNSYETLEITGRDIDTNLVVDYIVPKGEEN